MRSAITTSAVLMLIPMTVQAQAPDRGAGQGSVFFGPGGVSGGSATTASVHFGGNAEVLVYKGLAVGPEIGYLAPWHSMSDGIGVLSANGSYNFFPRRAEQKAVPFVTGGYTLFFRSGTANGFNFGGGVNWWFKPKVGLRLEFRDQVWPGRYSNAAHFFEFRVGVALR